MRGVSPTLPYTNSTHNHQHTQKATQKTSSLPTFGSDVEYAEPAWYRGCPTPYYNEHHVAWRAHVRAWVDAELIPHIRCRLCVEGAGHCWLTHTRQ